MYENATRYDIIYSISCARSSLHLNHSGRLLLRAPLLQRFLRKLAKDMIPEVISIVRRVVAGIVHGVVKLLRRVRAVLAKRLMVEAVIAIVILHGGMRQRMHQSRHEGVRQRSGEEMVQIAREQTCRVQRESGVDPRR